MRSGKGSNVRRERDPEGKAARTFEELHVYQQARQLTNAIYASTRTGAWSHDFGLVDQIRRAAVSIMSNIAEGFERGTSPEFIQFLYIAKGSAGEVRAQLEIARDQDYLPPSDCERLHEQVRRISGMLSNFIAYLQRSDYSGEKFARPKRRAAEAQQQRLDALRQAQLVNMQAAHPPDPSSPSPPSDPSPPSPPSDPSHPSSPSDPSHP